MTFFPIKGGASDRSRARGRGLAFPGPLIALFQRLWCQPRHHWTWAVSDDLRRSWAEKNRRTRAWTGFYTWDDLTEYGAFVASLSNRLCGATNLVRRSMRLLLICGCLKRIATTTWKMRWRVRKQFMPNWMRDRCPGGQMRARRCWVGFVLLVFLSATKGFAEDWPEFRGAGRWGCGMRPVFWNGFRMLD
ncbi:MAG: hypothetical protein Ct9H300mP25_10070 [Acidobacteriota bacterium]|nr:MAG: hypothetical protein Ct9H300mP25_10070 [Acidobacteriota bacterium]